MATCAKCGVAIPEGHEIVLRGKKAPNVTICANSVSTLHLKLADLEWFIELSRLLGHRLYSHKDIRDRQDAALTERLRQQALARIGDQARVEVADDTFFVGTVDYMVRETPGGQLGYSVLETNGGSSRGFDALAAPDVERLLNGYVEMLRFVEEDGPLLIVVSHMDMDLVLTQKLLLCYRLKEALERKQPSRPVRVLSVGDFSQQREANESLIVLSPYSQTTAKLYLQDNKVYLQGRRVHLIIGDAALASHHQLTQQRANVVAANWVFPVTGHKYATYATIERVRDLLTPHGIHPLRFWQAWNRSELEAICEAQRSETIGLVIKPFQGSGGTGVLPVVASSVIPDVVDGSLGEFYVRYGRRRSPFPYTICEKIDPWKATWRSERYNYDIRIYVARQGDTLIPAGCFFRLAPKPDKGNHSKESLVVNLSGYGGIATERALALNQESLNTVHLQEEDVVKMFAASVLLMATIAKQPIDWTQRKELIRRTQL